MFAVDRQISHRVKMHRAQLAAATIISATLFFVLVLVRASPYIISLDHAVNARIALLRTGSLTSAVATLTALASVPLMAAVLAGFFIALWVGCERRPAVLLLISAITGTLLFVTAKIIVHAARPAGALMDVSGWSFPSGHATLATIFFIFLSHLFEETRPRRVFLFLFNLLALCMIVLVCFSRIYLGVHWLSDVAGGMLLGVISSCIARLAIEDRPRGVLQDSRRAIRL